MKKFNIFKIVQLSLLILVTLISVYLLMQPEVKQYIFASTPATILFVIIWIVLLASYVFLLIDFSILSSIKLNYHNLYGVAYSDPLSGIPKQQAVLPMNFRILLQYSWSHILMWQMQSSLPHLKMRVQTCIIYTRIIHPDVSRYRRWEPVRQIQSLKY